MKPAVIVVDMLRDNFVDDNPVAREGRKIIPAINRLLDGCRERGIKVIFACDSFYPEDFLFKSKLKSHSLRGTEGSKVVDDIPVKEGDIVLEKRRFSAFFKTDLDQTLRTFGIDTIAVCGMTTTYCVLATAIDGVCHDFYTIILEDCSCAHKEEVHRFMMDLYRKSPLVPILRVMTSHEFLKEFDEKRGS